MPNEYSNWFQSVAGVEPYPWQVELGGESRCVDRLIRIPTGFGKTAGTVLTWLFHRVERGDGTWPTRLVVALPMRVLVEQTFREIVDWCEEAGLKKEVDVHLLMGGVEAGQWVRRPEHPSVLVGTQDMLLSRALNRGYASGRARWPMDFGLINHDALWVLDEVQLMDAGLATSAQLCAFRRADSEKLGSVRPSATWWMSATLQPRWLRTVDTSHFVPELEQQMLRIPRKDRSGPLWKIRKPLDLVHGATDPAELAALVRTRHRPGSLTLVVVNQVDRATAIFDSIEKEYSTGPGRKRRRVDDAPDLRLVHSRFRGQERAAWSQSFLHRRAEIPDEGRVVVATQVVEAGVDLSAQTLITDLAPWPSLVQRFGRCARYSRSNGTVLVLDTVPRDEKRALPYSLKELQAAHDALGRVSADTNEVGMKTLEHLEEHLAKEDPDLLEQLYPYEPDAVLRRHELDELFDTEADLGGADLDVSRFIRSGEERDVTLFWRPVEGQQVRIDKRDVAPVGREELCAAPLGAVRKWLQGRQAYVLDYLEGVWISTSRRALRPGMMVLVPCSVGGYDPERGWTPRSTRRVLPASRPEMDPLGRGLDESSESEEDDALSKALWKTVAFHGFEVSQELDETITALGISEPMSRVLHLAGRWHDAGKAHEVFQRAIRDEARAEGAPLGTRRDLAKAPDGAWKRGYDRPGFRHELVSTLALFELLRRAAPHHPGLLATDAELLRASGIELPEEEEKGVDRVSSEHPLAQEIADLSADELDLLAFLVCSHHGKVRCAWTSTPKDQQTGTRAIHGVREEDVLPDVELADEDGARHTVPSVRLWVEELAAMGLGPRYGRSWTERVLTLRERLGPFQLAYLEALLRAADWRASGRSTPEGDAQ